MKILKVLKFLFFLLIAIFIWSCHKDDDFDTTIEISCHRTVLIGTWDVSSEFIQHYELQDSTVTSNHDYRVVFRDDGTGRLDNDLTSEYAIGFTWGLQCNPDALLINRLSLTPLSENPMEYTAFSDMFKITKITAGEILMSAEYDLGNNETRRNVMDNLLYIKVE